MNQPVREVSAQFVWGRIHGSALRRRKIHSQVRNPALAEAAKRLATDAAAPALGNHLVGSCSSKSFCIIIALWENLQISLNFNIAFKVKFK